MKWNWQGSDKVLVASKSHLDCILAKPEESRQRILRISEETSFPSLSEKMLASAFLLQF